jgi:hypothetical protein
MGWNICSIDNERGDNMRNFHARHIYFKHIADMICLEAQYFNLNKILLQGSALWPFQQSKLVKLQFIINLIILLAAIICQVKKNNLISLSFQ